MPCNKTMCHVSGNRANSKAANHTGMCARGTWYVRACESKVIKSAMNDNGGNKQMG